jgi:hypothetical protein
MSYSRFDPDNTLHLHSVVALKIEIRENSTELPIPVIERASWCSHNAERLLVRSQVAIGWFRRDTPCPIVARRLSVRIVLSASV